ncbi:hypothetical protein PR048_032136 [Dryococelus australis]|uniref:Uncharacterized protein n=1 Tax=Dryococelus australis TaxID=614101 RepID=A0ABQ9G4L1_9NEOP|nr:hypothetical protein PR048_032136 [Dryococelus australis]
MEQRPRKHAYKGYLSVRFPLAKIRSVPARGRTRFALVVDEQYNRSESSLQVIELSNLIRSLVVSDLADDGNTSTTALENPAWLHVARLVARLLDDCGRRVADVKAADVSSAMSLCLKIRALKSLDKVLRQDVIPLGQGMELLRFTSHVSPTISCVAVRLFASHVGEPGSIPGEVNCDFSHVGIVPDDAASRWVFSGISRFLRPFILALFHTHLASFSLALKTSMLTATLISPLHLFTYVLQNRPEKVLREDVQQLVAERLSNLLETHVLRFSAADPGDDDQPDEEHVQESGKVNVKRRRNEEGRGWGIAEKTRRPTASSGMIPTCENPVTRPGVEPGSPWREVSRLTAQLPQPPYHFESHPPKNVLGSACPSKRERLIDLQSTKHSFWLHEMNSQTVRGVDSCTTRAATCSICQEGLTRQKRDYDCRITFTWAATWVEDEGPQYDMHDSSAKSRAQTILNGSSQRQLQRDSVAGRIRRRHYRHMFPLMVVGFMTMASFLVPLGFQFMAMLGGKALLLSKIALMMSTFQGIKKVTSAGYNYGFYHVPPSAELYHSHAAHHPEVWRRTMVPEAGKSYIGNTTSDALGAAVVQRSDYSPSTKANRAQLPESPTWESRQTMPLVGGSLASPRPPHSGAAPYSPHFTLIGSQDLDDDASMAQLQAYQQLLSVLPTQAPAVQTDDGYQGSMAQPLPLSNSQHVLAVIPYLQNNN